MPQFEFPIAFFGRMIPFGNSSKSVQFVGTKVGKEVVIEVVLRKKVEIDTPVDGRAMGLAVFSPQGSHFRQPCRIGPLSTHNYVKLAEDAVHDIGSGMRVFAGQRAEGFYVDLGAIFDLGDLRPFEQLHTTFGQNLPGLSKPAAGVNATANVNVHSIAIEVSAAAGLTANGQPPKDPTNPMSTVGVWTTASRQQAKVKDSNTNTWVSAGPFVQVSRLGNPLVNEVVIPLGQKDYWNMQPPSGDSAFEASFQTPELAQLLPILYPGVFPNLAAYNASGGTRADLVAILLTGIPPGSSPVSRTTPDRPPRTCSG